MGTWERELGSGLVMVDDGIGDYHGKQMDKSSTHTPHGS